MMTCRFVKSFSCFLNWRRTNLCYLPHKWAFGKLGVILKLDNPDLCVIGAQNVKRKLINTVRNVDVCDKQLWVASVT